MAVASIRTKLPLSTWAKIMGIHPLHFEQVRLGDADPHCGQLIFQHNWQNSDHVSREEIAQAIAEAEAKIEQFLGYRLIPSWEVDEWKATARPFISEHVNFYSSDVRGFNTTVKADWGYLISGGIQAKELITAGAAITYSDLDGDGYKETASLVVPTSVLDKDEIGVFYPDKDGDDTWEIRPVEVSIASGQATITFRRELAVNPLLLDVYDIEGAEALGEEDGDFLEEVDIYRRYNDPQTQATFLWEPFAGGWCSSCANNGCASCAYSVQTGCLLLRGDPRTSIVAYHPADWDSDENDFTRAHWVSNRQPDLVRLYYYAGYRDKSAKYKNRLSPDWERTIAYMAAASLERPPCDCSGGKANWDKWKFDLALLPLDEVRRTFYGHSSDIENPFGSRLGEVQAWRKVKQLMVGTAVRT